MSDQTKTIILETHCDADYAPQVPERVHLYLTSESLKLMEYQGSGIKALGLNAGISHDVGASWHEGMVESIVEAWEDDRTSAEQLVRGDSDYCRVEYSCAHISETGVYLESVPKFCGASMTTTSDRVSFEVLKSLLQRPEGCLSWAHVGSTPWENGRWCP
jgi:hypothetical protein